METYKTLRELFMTLCNTEVDTAVILGHINPDGDAVGSVMGVAYYLRENFPCKFREIIPYTAPGLAKGVQNYVEQDTTFDPFALLEGRVPKDRPYVAIACDCAAPDRIAGEEWLRRAAVRVTLDQDDGCAHPARMLPSGRTACTGPDCRRRQGGISVPERGAGCGTAGVL